MQTQSHHQNKLRGEIDQTQRASARRVCVCVLIQEQRADAAQGQRSPPRVRLHLSLTHH